ncbi:MAG: response regulator transcription factor [Caldilineaceae bacterium]
MKANILMVDNDVALQHCLEEAGFCLTTTNSAADALQSIRGNPPDLILLDINLPGLDGFAELRHMQHVTQAPILLLSTRHREVDEIVGLELGADDFIAKPCHKDILLARVRAAVRRAHGLKQSATCTTALHVGALTIDVAAFTVTAHGQPVALTVHEFWLLYILAQHIEQVLTLNEIIEQVWGDGYAGEPQVVYVAVRMLRRKLTEIAPDCGCCIVTVRGVGYKLCVGG